MSPFDELDGCLVVDRLVKNSTLSLFCQYPCGTCAGNKKAGFSPSKMPCRSTARTKGYSKKVGSGDAVPFVGEVPYLTAGLTTGDSARDRLTCFFLGHQPMEFLDHGLQRNCFHCFLDRILDPVIRSFQHFVDILCHGAPAAFTGMNSDEGGNPLGSKAAYI